MPKKVLIIEDEADTRFFYRAILEDMGFEMIEAKDGEEGIETAKQVNPDLIILDLMMPKKGGLKVIQYPAFCCLYRYSYFTSSMTSRITEQPSLRASSLMQRGGAILTHPPPTPTGANINRPLRKQPLMMSHAKS